MKMQHNRRLLRFLDGCDQDQSIYETVGSERQLVEVNDGLIDQGFTVNNSINNKRHPKVTQKILQPWRRISVIGLPEKWVM